MNIFDAEKLLLDITPNGLIKKPDVLPVTLKRLILIKNGQQLASLDKTKHFVGQDWWLRFDTLGNWQFNGPRGDIYDVPVISAVDGNGCDLGRVPVELFFL